MNTPMGRRKGLVMRNYDQTLLLFKTTFLEIQNNIFKDNALIYFYFSAKKIHFFHAK